MSRPADSIAKLADYLWWLLPVFLKKKDRAASMVAQFCEIWGEQLDDARKTLIVLIPELLVTTASGAYLDLLARPRKVFRQQNESDTSLRTRVLAAHILQRKGGTLPGMTEGLARLGFTVDVSEPYRGSSHWPRFQLCIRTWDGQVSFPILFQAVRRLKPAHTRAVLDCQLEPGRWDDDGFLDDGGVLDDFIANL